MRIQACFVAESLRRLVVAAFAQIVADVDVQHVIAFPGRWGHF